MPPADVPASPQELQWLNEFMAAQTAYLAQTSGAKAARDFKKAMGGAAPEIQQAWLEADPSTVDAAASLAGDPGDPGEPAQPAQVEAKGTTVTRARGPGEDHETIAKRIYAKAVAELSEDEVKLDDADLTGIWQDAWNAAASWTPETEEEAVSLVTDSFTMKIMDEVDGDRLYEIINGFIQDIRRLSGNAS
jgi:hypothetical protein